MGNICSCSKTESHDEGEAEYPACNPTPQASETTQQCSTDHVVKSPDAECSVSQPVTFEARNANDEMPAKTQSIDLDANAIPVRSCSASALGEMKDRLSEVRRLANRLLYCEAARLLRVVDESVQHLLTESSADTSNEVGDFLRTLRADVMLQSLREFLKRYDTALAEIACAQSSNAEWAEFELRDKSISEQFVLSVKVRYKTKQEQMVDGPSAQFVICADARFLPFRVSQRIAIERETDLTAHVMPGGLMVHESIDGTMNSLEQLFSACVRIVGRMTVLPFKSDIFELREFTALRDPPLPGLGPNMVCMMNTGPAPDDQRLGPFEVPPCTKGYKRQHGTMLRFLEPEETPNHLRMTLRCQMGINVPTWLLPISMVKRILAHLFSKGFKSLTDLIRNEWSNLPHKTRMETCQDLYGPLAFYDEVAVPHDSLDGRNG